jgi:hypothetical protein
MKGNIMNKTALSTLALVSLASLVGCASTQPVGRLYTEVQLPVTATSNNGPAPKVGVAECRSYLALITVGDASIEAAKKNGGITKVHHVDWEAKNILGIYGTYRVTVHGE